MCEIKMRGYFSPSAYSWWHTKYISCQISFIYINTHTEMWIYVWLGRENLRKKNAFVQIIMIILNKRQYCPAFFFFSICRCLLLWFMLGRSPGEGKGYPLQYSGLENSIHCTVYGVVKSWTRLSDFRISLSCFHFLGSWNFKLNFIFL